MLCDNCIHNKQISKTVNYCKEEESIMNTILIKNGNFIISGKYISFPPLDTKFLFKCYDYIPNDEYIPKTKFINRITNLK